MKMNRVDIGYGEDKLTPLAALVHTDAHASAQQLTLHGSQTAQDLIRVLPWCNRASPSLSAVYRRGGLLCFCQPTKLLLKFLLVL